MGAGLSHAWLILTFSPPLTDGETPKLVKAWVCSEPAHLIIRVFPNQFYTSLTMETGDDFNTAAKKLLGKCGSVEEFKWVLPWISDTEKEIFK